MREMTVNGNHVKAYYTILISTAGTYSRSILSQGCCGGSDDCVINVGDGSIESASDSPTSSCCRHHRLYLVLSRHNRTD